MNQPSAPSEGNLQTGRPEKETLWDSAPEIVMHPDTLIVLVQRYEESRQRKTFKKDALPWFALAAAFLLPLVTADFQDRFQVPSGIWGGFALFAVVACLAAGSLALIDLFNHRNDKPMEADDLIEQMVVGRQQARTDDQTQERSESGESSSKAESA